ncbi:hypothetical protein Tco_0334603, partial [Tanacetum coccineum]
MTSIAGEAMVSVDGKASNAGPVLFKTTSRVKFGYPGKQCVAVRDKAICLWAEASDFCCRGSVINYSFEAIPIGICK